jgi:hypothetical protein
MKSWFFKNGKYRLQLTWPTFSYRHCEFSGRRDIYFQAQTIARVAFGTDRWLACVSFLGFGLGIDFDANDI